MPAEGPLQCFVLYHEDSRACSSAASGKKLKTDMYTGFRPTKKEYPARELPLCPLCPLWLVGFRCLRVKSLPCHESPRSTATTPATLKLQKNYCFACGQNNPDGMRLEIHSRRRAPDLRLQIPPRQALHRTSRPLPRRHHRHHPRRRYGQSEQASPRRRPDQRDDRRIPQARPAAQTAARRGQGSQRPRPPTHQRSRNQNEKNEVLARSRESSSPSTPKKCSESSSSASG